MKIKIREENKADEKSIYKIVKSAFYREDKAEKFNEWELINDIRKSDGYIKELSLVVTFENKVVGYIIFTPVQIVNGKTKKNSLALGPIAIEPSWQNKGLGSLLIQEGIKRAKDLNHKSLVVIGEPHYYTRFGFELASKWEIGINNDFNSAYIFALELVKDSLKNVKGNIKYLDCFYNEKGELI